MPLILAIEPDRHQASQLQAIARGRLHAELVLEASAERALKELGDRVPDLILVAALMSPKDEAALAERLRALNSAAAHVHTLTIPVLAAPRSRPRISGVLSALRREKPQESEHHGCDPAVFAEQCATYLDRAMAERKELESMSPFEEAPQLPGPAVPIFGDRFEAPVVEEAVVGNATVAGETVIGQVGQAGQKGRAGQVAQVGRAGTDQLGSHDPLDPPDSPNSPDPFGPPDPLDLPVEAALDAPMLPVDNQLRLEALPDPVVDDVELPPVAQLEADTNEAEAGVTVDDDRLLGPSMLDEDNAAAPGAGIDEDRLLGPSTVFEIVTETEVGGIDEKEKDLDNYEEDFGAYIELDLSEFLDQPAPTVPAAGTSLNASAEPQAETEAVAPARNAPAEIHPKAEGIQVAASVPEPAAAEPDEADWLEVVEALRRDVERLDAAPPVPARLPKPIKKLPRKLKGKTVQDDWGLFDPEQCGFAALLAKLDEVTQT